MTVIQTNIAIQLLYAKLSDGSEENIIFSLTKILSCFKQEYLKLIKPQGKNTMKIRILLDFKLNEYKTIAFSMEVVPF